MTGGPPVVPSSSSSTSANVPSSSTGPAKQIPRDAVVMQALLKEMGVAIHEPRVVNQMLDFVYRYVTNVVEEARFYSVYAKKKSIDMEDIKLAIRMANDKSVAAVPPREVLMDLAKSKNSQPLPLLKSTSGLRLPPDRFCLIQPNYHLEFNQQAIASSTSSRPMMSMSNVRLPGSASSAASAFSVQHFSP